MSNKSVVEIKVVNGKLVVAFVPEPEITLNELLSGINEHNLHRDVRATGPESKDK